MAAYVGRLESPSPNSLNFIPFLFQISTNVNLVLVKMVELVLRPVMQVTFAYAHKDSLEEIVQLVSVIQ